MHHLNHHMDHNLCTNVGLSLVVDGNRWRDFAHTEWVIGRVASFCRSMRGIAECADGYYMAHHHRVAGGQHGLQDDQIFAGERYLCQYIRLSSPEHWPIWRNHPPNEFLWFMWVWNLTFTWLKWWVWELQATPTVMYHMVGGSGIFYLNPFLPSVSYAFYFNWDKG